MTRDTQMESAAFMGLDWADQHHDIALQAAGSATVEHRRIAHTPEALRDWIAELRARFGGQPVGVAVETSRGPVIHALLEHDFLVLYPVNPRALKRFRQAFTPSNAKDDAPDADLLRELVAKHRNRLRAWLPNDVETRALQRLTQYRRTAVNEQTRLAQRLRSALKEYFPQSLELAGDDLTSPMACAFLRKWPTLDAVRRAQPKTLRDFYHKHGCRHAALIERRLELVRTAVPLTTDRAIIDTAVLVVQTLLAQLEALRPNIERFDQEIARRFAAHADHQLFSSLPGSGAALAPRLLAAFGSNRERFDCAQEVSELSGIAPVTERSGKSTWVHWRWAASTFVRQSFHEFANCSIRFSPWARAYYHLQRERGKDHHAAVRALAFKWIRILWRCWKDRMPYDEARYTRSLIQRGSPVAARLAPATAA